MKVALVHDWLVGMRGGEKCLAAVCELFPDADLYTLFHVKGAVSPLIERRRIYTSFLQRIPGIARFYRRMFPVFPWAIEGFNFAAYDGIVSLSHCVAKGIVPPPRAWHCCYCFSPMRYVWDMAESYVRSPLERRAFSFFAPFLRAWDVGSSARVDAFAAVSHFVRQRIAKYYRRESRVIHPPVDDLFFFPREDGRGEYFLVVGALSPYKRVDLAVEAFNRLKLPLVVVGSGPEERRLRRQAAANVIFAGWQPTGRLVDFYQKCRAVIFPGVEDFGLVPVEAQAMGRPVIAFGAGGVLETVIPLNGQGNDSPTGVFFFSQTPEAVADAVQLFLRHEDVFDPLALRRHVEDFRGARFRQEMILFLQECGKMDSLTERQYCA